MASPTLTLAVIARDEEKNINRFLDSVEGCFDEIIVCDTGSLDQTKEIAASRNCKVVEFTWIDDFSAARNFAFSHATCDYIMWLDLDDVLFNKENFVAWKNNAMEFADLWMNTYNYALDPAGKPCISFLRERVVKRSLNPCWRYELHEGIDIKPTWKNDYAVSWSVNHLRDAEDMKKDKSRNISILDKMSKKPGGLNSRMLFYYAKEKYETGDLDGAYKDFVEVVEKPDLELHDRILAHQYGCYSAQMIGDRIKDEFKEEKYKWYDRAIEFALNGLRLDVNRAEFYVAAADVFIKKQDLIKALPLYSAAKNCTNASRSGPYASPIFNFDDCYGHMPTLQMAKIFFHMGRMDESEALAKEVFEKYKNPEASLILGEINRVRPLIDLEGEREDVEDVIITCPPNQAYPFDEEIYKSKGMGGSETALIEMARLIKEKTNRPVKVFNARTDDLVADSGVEYISVAKTNEYFSKKRPKVNINWRHNIKLTKAPTYLWCHDLTTQTVEAVQNFDKILCLSEFHKQYVMGRQGVPADKIIVTRNGISPAKFAFEKPEKNPNKLVWMSSPDRGLDRAMKVCDIVRQTHPDIELHVYYGLENLYKYGMQALADHLKRMMDERPWVKYHGFTEQNEMYKQVADAAVWVHPCNFIETFCITALEMLALKVFPVTRSLGALKNTLADAASKGMANLLDHDCVTDEEFQAYASAVNQALESKSWEKIDFDIEKHSWSSVADEWIQIMGL